MQYYLVRIGDDRFIGKLGVMVHRRKSAYHFTTMKHAQRVQVTVEKAFLGDVVRVVGPFKYDETPNGTARPIIRRKSYD